MILHPELYDEFRNTWPLSRVRSMQLPEYSKAKKNNQGEPDTFTYWIEAKLQDFGSIWGGSSFKFGIYSRSNEEDKDESGGRSYTKDYAWYGKYGSNANDAFTTVRSHIVDVIEAIQRDDLAAIDAIDLGAAYKWKIAFHYQQDINHPSIINIFAPEALVYLCKIKGRIKISECHRKLLADIGDESVYDFSERLWARYQASLVPEIIDNADNRHSNLNTIYFGPPGTGKTYQVLQFLKRVDALAESKRPKGKAITLRNDATFWHLAPGQRGYLWPELKKSDRLGYEWCSSDYGDLKNANINNAHWSIIKRFSMVKKGDYFAVISGSKLLGIAEAVHDYDFSKSSSDEFDFQTVKVEWIKVFTIPPLLNSTQTMTFCRLNGGSRWASFTQALTSEGLILTDPRSDKKTGIAESSPGYNYMLVTFHQSYSYEDFIQGIKPLMDEVEEDGETEAESLRYRIEPGVFYRACDHACQKAGFEDLNAALSASASDRKTRFAEAQPFYLVIDEINRGNIANIFGELITLIEGDKRLGMVNEVIVDLPYSKTRFGVPSNLYLIGTMNTADRSVETLDSALRRRFSFVASYPNSEAIEQPEDLAIDLRMLLSAINSRIEQVLDRDHTIGHAYFTGIKDAADPLEALVEVFRKKIIPQLEEYLYNAPWRIHAILGDDFICKSPPKFKLFEEDGEAPLERWTVAIPPTGSDEERLKAEAIFKRLYEKTDV